MPISVPDPPAGQGAFVVVVIMADGSSNQTQVTAPQSDVTRIVAAWQALTNNPEGSAADFSVWMAQQVQNQLNAFVLANEQQQIVPPAWSFWTQ